ncbi:hypothetical protein JRO89_XS15G0172100 [Xanthoceras sorbifolium]|uniref:Protein kinase domain-containing protein n=1 Tax=Xanthoceras sorbifolium TaxID=99658 RepID=A0ABQ8H2R8_9ROSI|nr:hypothetical protein JRO89_XS15G0172100 [Xanthoceras sorbifolium]
MSSLRYSKLFLEGLIWFAVVAALLIRVCVGSDDQFAESESFFTFIRAVDPQNVLRIGWNGRLAHPCSRKLLQGVKCNQQEAVASNSIVEIRLENMNLSGRIDAGSLCRLRNLRVLSLARNLIRGGIPNSITCCARLTYLNLSSNHLSGRIPVALIKLKHLRSLDISNNQFSGIVLQLEHGFKYFYRNSVETSVAAQINGSDLSSPTESKEFEVSTQKKHWYEKWATSIPLFLGMGFILLLAYYVGKRAAKAAREREILKALEEDSPSKTLPPVVVIEEEEGMMKPEKIRQSELVFFVDEHERFKLEDLLEATADLRSHGICSSLYKVILKNSSIYAVKRLKNLQASFEEFGETMRRIGNLKHPNILPLVCFNSTIEEKLLIYKYQSNGSLLNLLENYVEGKRDFSWKLRLSIAIGIAKGLDFMYQRSDDQEIIPHGNLKLSNILLDENENALVSEYGYSKFIDPKRGYCFPSNGYTAPEKTLSEQGDVYSFGVILLELLTGKNVEKTGIDLPKWVKAMVREEWTGEVFDKEVSKAGKQWAFPLLNVSLKCVSNSPDDRPTMAEVLERLEEVVHSNDQEQEYHDHSMSLSSMGSSQLDCCLLHNVIPETWDTPGSNY